MNNGKQPAASSYVRYLPAIYQRNDFMGRFLSVFEEILEPVRDMASTLSQRFDPALAPSPLAEFLGSWVGLGQRGHLPDNAWRHMIKQTLVLHRWRGTRRGLRLALRLATGHEPLITENTEGLALSGDARLGINTPLDGGADPHITVVFRCKESAVDTRLVDDIIRDHKPAHLSCSVVFQP